MGIHLSKAKKEDHAIVWSFFIGFCSLFVDEVLSSGAYFEMVLDDAQIESGEGSFVISDLNFVIVTVILKA